jgi:hypothetical protein
VCTTHEQYATANRPTTASLLGVVNTDAAAVRGRAWSDLLPNRDVHDAVPASRWRRLLRLDD